MAKEKKGYTEKQNIVAEWIMSGRNILRNNTHDKLREDDVLRKYAVNPLAQAASHWYYIVRDGKASRTVHDLGGGVVNVVGNGGPGGYTQTYRSSYGITIINTERAGKKPNGLGHHKVFNRD